MSGIIVRLLAVAVLLALSSAERQGDFLIELSPAMDGRKVKPYNISLNINGSLNQSLSVSSVNFRKNVTLSMQLFAWYNGDWILKKARLLRTPSLTQRSPTRRLLHFPGRLSS